MDLFRIAILLTVAAAEKTSCPAEVKDKAFTGAALVMKDRSMSKKQALKAEEQQEENLHLYGPHKVGRAMSYFMNWAQGAVQIRKNRELVQKIHTITDMALVEKTDLEKIGATAASLLATAERKKCGESSADRSWSLLETTESDGVQHFVLRSEGSEGQRLQYLAAQHEQVLWADPPVECMLQRRGTPDLEEDAGNASDGGGDLLDVETDSMVKDCKKLFTRTAEDICQKTMNITVLRATRQIIDGFEINMDVEVTGPAGKTTYHFPQCLFETSSDHTDASLVQSETDPAEKDPTELEKQGLIGTLRMQSDLCKADTESSKDASFVQDFGFGELSLYKGFEHVNDELGFIEVPLMEGAPSQVDFRKKYPKCFRLTQGKESVRNQGQCGSCWAFATASAGMNNLCASHNGAGSLASVNDRFEISVQQLMSCNAHKQGCQGGNAGGADTSIRKSKGLYKERDYKYKCGSGDPANHFDQASGDCKSFPWGATCATSGATPGWLYSGVSRVSGESSMKALVADGQSLYASMAVYGNFMKHKSGVYKSLSGGKKGGHAMVAMGYGTEYGTKYWLLQNSWGPSGWGEYGYGKVLRGSNLAGIEDNAYWIKAWVDGGKKAKCTDGPSSGLSSGGGQIPCTSAKNGPYGNLCKNPSWGSTVKANCPVTCDSCTQVGPPGPAPGPAPNPPAPNPPAPNPPAPNPPAPNPPAPNPPAPNPSPGGGSKASSCVKDATTVFGNNLPCVMWNQCLQDVDVKCKHSACTHKLKAGGIFVTHCNGEVDTEFCIDADDCEVVSAGGAPNPGPGPVPPPPPATPRPTPQPTPRPTPRPRPRRSSNRRRWVPSRGNSNRRRWVPSSR